MQIPRPMQKEMTKLTTTMKNSNAGQNSNGKVLQEYLQKVDSLSEEAVDVEKRQVSNEMYILKLDIETREKLQFIQKSIQNKQPGSCVFCGKVFKDEEELKITIRRTPLHVKVVICVTKELYVTHPSTVSTILSPSESDICSL